MADLLLNHHPVDDVVDQMSQAAANMDERFNEMMAQIRTHSEHFSGAAAEAWGDMSRNQGIIAAKLSSSFGAGAKVLNDMHEAITDSDNRGAQILGRHG